MRSRDLKIPIQPILGLPIIHFAGNRRGDMFGSSLSRRISFGLKRKRRIDAFFAVKRGEIVIKLLPAVDRREVSVCGVVRLRFF